MTERLREQIAREFWERNAYYAKHYPWGEALEQRARLAPTDAFIECFGGSLKGGIYRNEFLAAMTDCFNAADRVLALMRKYPDEALEVAAAE